MRKMVWITILLGLLITPSHAWAIGKGSSYIAIVYADSLNVREEASPKASVISSLKNGQKVKVMDEAYGWAQIQANGVTGWVAGYYLTKKINTVNVKQTSSLGNGVRVREGPGTYYPVLSSVNKGDLLTIMESANGWHKIRTAIGVEGWVTKQYVGDVGAVHTVKKATVNELKELAGKTIIIDPGHGGSDPGALGTTHDTTEKEINLTTAVYLKQELFALGAKVIMTRTSNEKKVSLPDRAAIGHLKGADAFISIHYNSSLKKTSGTLTFYQSESKDLRLSRAIESKLSQGIGLKSNGIAYGDFHVLRENAVPSSLVELGFLTNPYDESIVRKPSYQKKAAQAIAEGLVDYFKKK